MSEPLSAHEIEDVLSSIRRLVSEELRPAAPASAAVQPPVIEPVLAEPSSATPAAAIAASRAEPASPRVSTPRADDAPRARLRVPVPPAVDAPLDAGKLLLTPALRVVPASPAPDQPAAAGSASPRLDDARQGDGRQGDALQAGALQDGGAQDMAAGGAALPGLSPQDGSARVAAPQDPAPQDWQPQDWAPQPFAQTADPASDHAGRATLSALLVGQGDDGTTYDEDVVWAAPGDPVDDLPPVDAEWLQAGGDWSDDGPLAFVPHPRKPAPAAAPPRDEPLARAWAEQAEAQLRAELGDALTAEVHAVLRADLAADGMAADPDAGIRPPPAAPRAADPLADVVPDHAAMVPDADGAAFVAAATGPGTASGAPVGLFDHDATVLDEDMLRDLVRDIIREELAGALGERITRNVRKLVRMEVNRALTARDFG